jgi:MFS family permease
MSIVESRSVAEPAAPSPQSLRALSWLNFFLSGMQTAFGPIAAAYLAIRGWTAKDIGFVLTIGGIASLVSQMPGGALVDAVRAKRLLVATGVVSVAGSVLIFRLWPSFPLVALAQVLQGITGGVLGPGIVAITLGLVGHARLPERLGQNQRFAAAGGVAVTLTMALMAYSNSPWAMFVPAALAVPVLLSLSRIRAQEIDFGRASGAEPADTDRSQRASHAALVKNRRLLIFAACSALFQVASASMMPLLGAGLAYEAKRQAAPLIAALIIVPQLLVGLLAPWVGRSAEKHGRKPLLIVGFAALPIRAVLFAFISSPPALVAIQLLDVITGAVLGVMTAVVIADVTKGTGRFNLAQGMFGTVMGIGASVSPTLTGLIVDRFGRSAGFLSLAAEGFVALAVLVVFLPETREQVPT